MPHTFRTLQRNVVNYLQIDPDDSEALGIAGSGINDAIDMFNSTNWSWSYKTSGFGFVANQREYYLPTDFRTQRNLHTVNTAGEMNGRLGYYNPKQFDSRRRDQENNPSSYTIYETYPSGQLVLDKKPSQSWVNSHPSGYIGYNARIPSLTTSGQILDVPPEVESAILWYAKSNMAAIYSPAKIPFAETRFREQFNRLKKDESRRATRDWN